MGFITIFDFGFDFLLLLPKHQMFLTEPGKSDSFFIRYE